MKIAIVLTTLALAATAAHAGDSCCGASPKKTAAKPKAAAIVCPVMGTKIASVQKAAGKSTYQGKTYYFCCAGCKPQFDKNPAKYTKTAKG